MDPKLAKLKTDFAKWRITRKSKRSKTPADLRARVVEMTDSIKVSKLCSELGISHSALLKWRKDSLISSQPQFVQLPIPRELASSRGLEIQLERPDGVKLKISGVNDSIFASFVCSFMAGGGL